MSINANEVYYVKRDPTNSSYIEEALNPLSGSSSFVLIDSTGSLYAVSTSSLLGSNSSSYALTASFALNGGGSQINTGSFYPITTSYSLTSSYISGNIVFDPTQIYPLTASEANYSSQANFALSSLTASSINFVPDTASYALSALTLIGGIETSSYALTSSLGINSLTASSINFTPSTSSYSLTASVSLGQVISSSFASRSISSSYVSGTIVGNTTGTASWSTNALTASNINFTPSLAATASSISSSNLFDKSVYPLTASWSSNSIVSISSSFASSSISASNAFSASFALTASNINFVPSTSSYAGTSSILLGTANTSISSSFASSSISASLALNAIVLFAGTTVAPTFTDNANGSASISNGSASLYSNASGSGLLKEYLLSGINITASSFDINYYIVGNYNAGSPVYQITTDNSIINNTTIIPIFTLIRHQFDGLIDHLDWDSPGYALPNKLTRRLVKTERFSLESGLVLSTTGSTSTGPTVTAGVVWYGATNVSLPAFTSGSTFIFYAHSASVWSSSNQTILNNTQYDNGTNLTALGAGGSHFTINWIYKGISYNDPDVFMVLGNTDYSSLAAAAAAQPITNPPPSIASEGMLVGRVIMQKNVVAPSEVDTAFTTVFNTSPITIHNNLSGLDGGTAGQYYHLTSAEYTGVGTGVFVRQSGSLISGSLVGTASWANNTLTASSITFNPLSSSYAGTSSVLLGTITSASYAQTASLLLGNVASANQAISASFASASISSSFALSGSSLIGFDFVNTGSLVNNTGSLFLITTQSTSSYGAVFIDYRIISASAFRAGCFVGTWNLNGTASTNEYVTNDTSNSTDTVSMSLSLSGSNFYIYTNASGSTGWTVKTVVRFL